MEDNIQLSQHSQEESKIQQEDLKEQPKFDSQAFAIPEETKLLLRQRETFLEKITVTIAYAPKGGFLSLESEKLSFPVEESKEITKKDIAAAKSENRKELKRKMDEAQEVSRQNEESGMTLDEAMNYLLGIMGVDLSTDKAFVEDYESFKEMEKTLKRMEKFEPLFENHPEINSIYRERYHVLKDLVGYSKARIELIMDETYEGMTNHELQELKKKPSDEKNALLEKLLLCENMEDALRKQMDSEEEESEIKLMLKKKAGQLKESLPEEKQEEHEKGGDIVQDQNKLPGYAGGFDGGFPGYDNLDQNMNKMPSYDDSFDQEFPSYDNLDQSMNKMPAYNAEFDQVLSKNLDDGEYYVQDKDNEEQYQKNQLDQSFMHDEKEIPDMTENIPQLDETVYVSDEELERLQKELEKEEEKQEPESLLKKNQDNGIEFHPDGDQSIQRPVVDLEKQKEEAEKDLEKLDAFLNEKVPVNKAGDKNAFPEKIDVLPPGFDEVDEEELAAFDEMMIQKDREDELSRLAKDKKEREREKAFRERDKYQDLLDNQIPNHTDGDEFIAVKEAVWAMKLALRGEVYIGRNFKADFPKLRGLPETDERRSEKIIKHPYTKEDIVFQYNRLIQRCDNYIVHRGGMRRSQGQYRLNLIKEIKKQALSELSELRLRLSDESTDVPDVLLDVRMGQKLKDKLPAAMERKLKNSKTKAKDMAEYLSSISILEQENPARFKALTNGADSPVGKIITRMADKKFLADMAKQRNECLALLANKFRVLMNQNVPDRYLKENGQDPSDPILRRQYAMAEILNDRLYHQVAGFVRMSSYLNADQKTSFQKLTDESQKGQSLEMRALIREGSALFDNRQNESFDQLNKNALLLIRMNGENEEKKILRNVIDENGLDDLFEIRKEEEVKHLHFVQTDPVYVEKVKNGERVDMYEGYICSPEYKYKPLNGMHVRMAELLGVGGQLSRAPMKEELIPPMKLSSALDEGAIWSPEGLKEKGALIALNFLFGNTELNMENFECEGKNGMITHVSLAPDVEIKFQSGSPETLVRNFTNTDNMQAMLLMDDAVKQKILEMGPITLASQYGQLLSKSQMDALAARLKTLQDYLTSAEKNISGRRKLAQDKVKKYVGKNDRDQTQINKEEALKQQIRKRLEVLQNKMRMNWEADMNLIDDVETAVNMFEEELLERVHITYDALQALSSSEDMKKLLNKKDPAAFVVASEYKAAFRRAESDCVDQLNDFFTGLEACENEAAVREVLASRKTAALRGFEVL